MCSYCFRLKNSSEFPAEGDHHILFVDQGSCFTDMYVVRVNAGQCEVVHSESQQFGAKDIDRMLFNYFVEEIEKKRGVTIRPGTKQAIRLASGCKKLKEMLSSASRANNTVDGLIDGDEYQLVLTREQMEMIVKDQIDAFERMTRSLREAFSGTIDAVEMIGGGCRIDFMKRIVENVMGMPLRFTVDSASCIAKGAALLGVYEKVKETLALTNEWVLKSDKEKSDEYEMTEALEMKLRKRDGEQQRYAEAHNRFEA